MKLFFGIIGSIAIHLLAQSSFAGPISAGGPPNPDAICEAVAHGRILVLTASDGSFGEDRFCILGSALIQSYTLAANMPYSSPYFADAPVEAVRAFSGSLRPVQGENAASFCFRSSGEVIKLRTGQGEEIQICRFHDSSEIGLNTLYLGADAPANKDLADAINGGGIL